MKSVIISTTFTLLAAFTLAAPAPVAPRQFQLQITFEGATPEAYFTQSFPGDGSLHTISNALSISHIVSQGGGTCTFYGIDGSQTTTVGAQTVDVGPPQTQVSGACRAF